MRSIGTRRWRRLVAVAVLAAGGVAASCAGDGRGHGTTTYGSRQVFVAEEPHCDDEAACASELYVEGRRYVLTAERPERCDGRIVAVLPDEPPVEIRELQPGSASRYAYCPGSPLPTATLEALPR